MKRILRSPLLMGLAMTSLPANADTIPTAYRQVAHSEQVPADIFYAMALAESGRAYGPDHVVRPWPWTLNVHGKGVFYADRRSAWRAILASLAKKRALVDIGPMQVNWHYHQDRLLDPWNALDPYRNLHVAAGILKDCFERRGDWWLAVGCYHAPNNVERAGRYRERVRQHWRSLSP